MIETGDTPACWALQLREDACGPANARAAIVNCPYFNFESLTRL